MSGTYNECKIAMNTLISLLGELGFVINWKKVCGPSTCISFLGVEIDSVDMSLRLPENKLFQQREELAEFVNKRALQHLAGCLSWATRVLPTDS